MPFLKAEPASILATANNAERIAVGETAQSAWTSTTAAVTISARQPNKARTLRQGNDLQLLLVVAWNYLLSLFLRHDIL